MGGLPTSSVNGFAVHPSDSSVMYVAMREGIFRTVNAGATWTPVTNGPRNGAAIAVNPRRPSDVYVVTVDGRVFLSLDGGVTWDPRS